MSLPWIHSRNKKGQALVEFAFVLPILLLLMVVLLDVGIMLYTQITVTNAAWEGARAGATIVNPAKGDQEILAAVHQATYGLNKDKIAVDIDPEQTESPRDQPFPAPRGEPLTVTVVYDLDLAFPKIVVPLTGRAVTRMEYQNP